MDHLIVAMAATADGGGYWLAGAGGEIFHFGDAVNLEPPKPVTTRSAFVGITVDSSGTGAWTAKQDGVVLNFGTAADHGSLGVAPASRVTAIAAMPIPSAGAGQPLGYVLAEADGTVSTLGGATDYGSRSSTKLVAPIVALLPTPDRRGYWLIGADGSVFPFGDAVFEGAAGGEVRADPVVGAAATTDGRGYWLVTAGGNVLPFGDARSYGSIETPLDDPVVAIAVTPDGGGYWLASRSGRVFNFGDSRNYGFLGGHLASPVVAMAVDARRPGLLARRGRRRRVRLRRRRTTLPPATTVKPTSPAVGMAVTGNGSGDWLAESNGTVLPLGTATAHGSDSVPPASRVVSIAAMPAVAGSSYLQVPQGLLRLRHQLAPVRRAEIAEDRPAPGTAESSLRHGRLHRRRRRRGRMGDRVAEPVPAGRGAMGREGEEAQSFALRPVHLPQLPVVFRHDRPERPGGNLRRVLGHPAGVLPRLQLRLQLGEDRQAVRRLSGRGVAHVVARHRERHLRPVLVVPPGAQRQDDPGCARLPARPQAHGRDLLDVGPVAGDHRRLRAARSAGPDMGGRGVLDLAAVPRELRLLPDLEAGAVLRWAVRLRRRQDLASPGDPWPEQLPLRPRLRLLRLRARSPGPNVGAQTLS